MAKTEKCSVRGARLRRKKLGSPPVQRRHHKVFFLLRRRGREGVCVYDFFQPRFGVMFFLFLRFDFFEAAALAACSSSSSSDFDSSTSGCATRLPRLAVWSCDVMGSMSKSPSSTVACRSGCKVSLPGRFGCCEWAHRLRRVEEPRNPVLSRNVLENVLNVLENA